MINTIHSDVENIQVSKNSVNTIVSPAKKELYNELFLNKTTVFAWISQIIEDIKVIFEDGTIPGDLAYQKRLYSILIEALENIGRHSDIIDNHHKARFSFTENDGFYSIDIVNFCQPADYDKIQKYLYLNTLPLDEIKAIYKKTLMNWKISDRWGAGAGFLTIAKTIRAIDPNSKAPIFEVNHGGINGHVELKLTIKLPTFESIEKRNNEDILDENHIGA